MTANPERDAQAEADQLEEAANQAIAACDGDVRAALRAVIVLNNLEQEIQQLKAAASRGYGRGKPRSVEEIVKLPRFRWYDDP